jgi:hypothetical protein
LCLATVALSLGCAREQAQPPETFTWCPQPLSFSPPPPHWQGQGDNGGGTLGVRFILSGGGGQCISLAAYSSFVERDRRAALARLISRRDSLERREFLRELSLARARTDHPLSEREAVRQEFGSNRIARGNTVVSPHWGKVPASAACLALPEPELLGVGRRMECAVRGEH